ncbi:MAG: hypothetical protein U0Z17_04575 [Bacteroidales bacterium]
MKNIKKHYHLKASAEDIFTACRSALTIEIWTGAAAVMEPVARQVRSGMVILQA